MEREIVIRENIPGYMDELRGWLREIESEPLEGMSEFFRDRIGDYEDHMQIWARAYVRLAELVPETARTVLDLGCGTGLELDALYARRADISVTGIDLCPEMLARLREKHPGVKTVCGDYFRAELGTDVYDCAISVESLHHFTPEKKQGLYENIHRALKPGGVFFLVDYLACCEEEERLLMDFCREKRAAQKVPEDVFIHIDTPLTVAHETELLRNAGFSAVELMDCVEGASFVRCEKSFTF